MYIYVHSQNIQHTYICICMYVSMHTYRTYVSMYTLMCFIYKCVYTYIVINTHGYIIYIHVHVHTYEQCVLGSPRCMSEFILSVVSKGSQALSLYLGHHPWSL